LLWKKKIYENLRYTRNANGNRKIIKIVLFAIKDVSVINSNFAKIIFKNVNTKNVLFECLLLKNHLPSK